MKVKKVYFKIIAVIVGLHGVFHLGTFLMIAYCLFNKEPSNRLILYFAYSAILFWVYCLLTSFFVFRRITSRRLFHLNVTLSIIIYIYWEKLSSFCFRRKSPWIMRIITWPVLIISLLFYWLHSKLIKGTDLVAES